MRRRRPPTSSLELLLDTICNTFGGVLFVAMLLALLVQTAGKSQSEGVDAAPTEAELLAVEARVSRTLTELDSLQAAAALQQNLVRQLARPDMAPALANLDDLQRQRDVALGDQLRETARVAELQAESSRLAEQREAQRTRSKADDQARQQQHGRVGELERELAEAREKLDAETKARTQVARLPKLHETAKQEIPMVVRFGRLYVWHTYDRWGHRGGLNTDEFVVVEESLFGVTVAPMPFAGVRLTDDESSQIAVRARLASFNSSRHYLAFAIWPDSFGDFQALKKTLVALGFEYRLIPMPPGESIRDRGGVGGQVQ